MTETKATVRYRTTGKGHEVAYGPADLIRQARWSLDGVLITLKDGRSQERRYLSKLGKESVLDGIPMMWAYLHPRPRPANDQGFCWECQRTLSSKFPTEQCEDSSGIVGPCCARCARKDPWQRSYA